jgi:acetaldehyde dehydrogenase
MKKIGIIGSGKIAIDLLVKLSKQEKNKCSIMAGRRVGTDGSRIANDLNVPFTDKGITGLLEYKDELDLVIDATNAIDHFQHWDILKKNNLSVIDMTPSDVGQNYVPYLSTIDNNKVCNLNMVSCGGQTSIPYLKKMINIIDDCKYIEIVSSISSKSAGMGTRINLDQYISNTENAVSRYTGVDNVKVMLVINPAEPPVSMKTSISIMCNKVSDFVINKLADEVENQMKSYIPGFKIIVKPQWIDTNRLMTTIMVEGAGDYLPKYAGNLDIINSAAMFAIKDLVK